MSFGIISLGKYTNWLMLLVYLIHGFLVTCLNYNIIPISSSLQIVSFTSFTFLIASILLTFSGLRFGNHWFIWTLRNWMSEYTCVLLPQQYRSEEVRCEVGALLWIHSGDHRTVPGNADRIQYLVPVPWILLGENRQFDHYLCERSLPQCLVRWKNPSGGFVYQPDGYLLGLWRKRGDSRILCEQLW